jgi:transposase-like protein
VVTGCFANEFSTPDKELTEIQLRAARLLAMGESHKNISQQLGIDRTTIYRWRKLPTFSAELSQLTEAAMAEGRNRVVRDVTEINDIILSTLVDVAENDASGSARVSAARVLVDMVERAEDRADQATHNVMKDQSGEIRLLLEEIKAQQPNDAGAARSAGS